MQRQINKWQINKLSKELQYQVKLTKFTVYFMLTGFIYIYVLGYALLKFQFNIFPSAGGDFHWQPKKMF